MNTSPISHQTQITSKNIDNHKTVLPELPDNFVQSVFKILGKRDANRMSLVCKHWQQLYSQKSTASEDQVNFNNGPTPYSNPIIEANTNVRISNLVVFSSYSYLYEKGNKIAYREHLAVESSARENFDIGLDYNYFSNRQNTQSHHLPFINIKYYL